MKRIKYLFLTLILIIVFPIFVNAATSLSASTQTPIVGSIIYIQINVDYGRENLIKEAHYAVSYDTDNLELVEVVWTQSKGTYQLDSGIIYIDKEDNGQPWEYGGQVMLKLKVTKSGQNKVGIKENGLAYYVDGSIVSQTFSGITLNAQAASTDNSISTLYVEGYTITPTFSRNQHEYNLNVPSNVESVNIVAKRGSSTQTITGDGVRQLEYGDNRVRVNVEAQDGSINTYEIMINRKDDRTGDTTLMNLSVSNTSIKYEEDTTIYYATVSRSVENVLISARANDPAATLAGTGTKHLDIGRNVFDVKVISSNNQSTTYTLVITRSEEEIKPNEESTKLSSLSINSKIFELSDDKNIYLMGVTSDTKILNFDYKTKSETASVTIEGGEKIVEGTNIVKITVTEANEQTEEYIIIVYKDSNDYTVVSDLEEYESNTKDILIKVSENKEHLINTKEIKQIKSNDNIIHYHVVNKVNGLLYGLTITPDLLDTLYDFDTEFKLTNTTPLTYETKLPKDVEVTLYVGDTYKDNFNIKIYTYDKIGKYTLLTDGITVTNGYITFKTNGQTNYVFTMSTLIKNKVSPLKWIVTNLIKIIIILIAISLIGFIVYKFIIKKKKTNKDEPEY